MTNMHYQHTQTGNLHKLNSIDNSNYWELYFWICNYNKELVELKNFLINKEEYILEKYEPRSDGGTNLGPDTTTARYSVYNIFEEFNNTCLQDVKQFINIEYKRFLKELSVEVKNPKITAWYNILHYGQMIDRHFHGDLSRMSGNMVVSCYNSSTFYELPFNSGVYEIKNQAGNLVLFNSVVPHWTSKNDVHDPRITLAADFYDDEMSNLDLQSVILNL